jgi:hypothetical protein
MVPLKGPALPGAATTTKPEFHAASAARSKGLSAVEVVGIAPSERLITRIPRLTWLATAH